QDANRSRVQRAHRVPAVRQHRRRGRAVVPRPATGQVLIRKRKRGVIYALRFHAYGERRYVTLGSSNDGWDRRRAENELANIQADVRRGTWRPPDPEPQEPEPEPTFHEFASRWLGDLRHEGLAPRTLEGYEWQLTHHLLPFFAGHRLSDITIAEVDRYRHAKVRDADVLRAAI